MSAHTFKTRGVCARQVDFAIEDGKLHDVQFVGGCDGNLRAIGKLVEGMSTEQVVELLEGNTCGAKPTSCADQLVCAIKQAQG